MPMQEDLTLAAGTIKRIHVNQFTIKRFHKTGVDEPAWIVRTSKGTYNCRHWTVDGSVEGIQSLSKPAPGCPARLWLETLDAVTLYQAEKQQDEVCEVAA